MRFFLILSTVCLAFAATVSARAQSTGLQVSLIPAGTQAHMTDSKGKTALWAFRGQQRDVWVADMFNGSGQLVRTEQYNDQGYLVAVVHADGRKERFVPYRCSDQLGECKFTHISASGKKKKFKSKVWSTGSIYHVTLNGKKFGSFKLGIYNIRTMLLKGTYWTKLTRIDN